ncbi:MAG TPA: peptidase M1, partial [Bacteroidia bacterium]
MKKIFFWFSALAFIAGCTNTVKVPATTQNHYQIKADSTASRQPPALEFHTTSTRAIDIVHTKLEVSFDWAMQYLFGKATITLKPYFYPTKQITLDAKGFEVKEVSLVANAIVQMPAKSSKAGKIYEPGTLKEASRQKLLYSYNKTQLTITLDKEYTRNDSLQIYIEYVAKPNERETHPGSAITSDKGLYFINPLGKDKSKPIELWTQGEPESNSCWFPTVDKPNERMTQEIYITLDSAHKNFVTLSNGLLISSNKNPDGSRTDYWKQSVPAAPYLTMITVGDFAIVKDKWKNKD